MKSFNEQPEFEGNREHLELLFNVLEKGDIAIWNNWRKENPETVPDLTGADLCEMDTLRGIDLYGAMLSHTLFSRSNLENANFSEANCEGVDFGDAILTKVNFTCARISSCNLIMADLSEACLENANLCNSTLMHTNLSGALLTGAQLYETHLVNCNITNAICRYIMIGREKTGKFPENRDFTSDEIKKLFTEQQLVTKEIRNIIEN